MARFEPGKQFVRINLCVRTQVCRREVCSTLTKRIVILMIAALTAATMLVATALPAWAQAQRFTCTATINGELVMVEGLTAGQVNQLEKLANEAGIAITCERT